MDFICSWGKRGGLYRGQTAVDRPNPKAELIYATSQDPLEQHREEKPGQDPANVWCGNCRRFVHIIVDSGKMEGMCLLLSGRCRDCNGSVARLIESEEGRQERNEEGEVRKAGPSEVLEADRHPSSGVASTGLRSYR